MHNLTVLTGTVYRQLAEVNRLTFDALSRAERREPTDQVVHAVEDAGQALKILAELLGVEGFGKNNLGRHLYFVGHYYSRNEHGQYANDVVDIRDRDLPGLAEFVAKWEQSLLDPGLVAAIERSWTDRNFLAVVRDAFVYLEQRLRELGQVDPTSGLTGERLVSLLLGPKAPQKLAIPAGTLLGPVTGGEDQGLIHLVKGAFLFARNPTAHRPIVYKPEEAFAVLGLVDLCLRIIDPAARG